jgi:tetratricopeptide (TPR) repeat protein
MKTFPTQRRNYPRETSKLLQEAHNLYRAQNFPEALAAARKLIQYQPQNPAILCLAAVCERRQGNTAAAEEHWARAVRADPRSFDAHFNLGLLFLEGQRFSEAESALRRALALSPNHVGVLNSLGNLLAATKRFDEARDAYEQVLAQQPLHTDAQSNLGNVLVRLGQFAEAVAAYQAALSVQPDHINALLNLGTLFWQTLQYADAESLFRRVLSIDPNRAQAYFNLGNVLKDAKRLPEAEIAYRDALRNKPDYADASWNLGMLLLYLGKFEEGWPFYEVRHSRLRSGWCDEFPHFSFPRWNGENLSGRSIVIWPEQGFGDEIQMVRYIPLLRELGATKITLVCKRPLEVLFRNASGADQVLAIQDAGRLESHDYWVFPQSLPLHNNTSVETIPAALPYLKAPIDRIGKWAARLPPDPIKIGLVWKGVAVHKNDSNRSLPSLETLAPLWSVSGVTFVSLQKGQAEDEATNPPPTQPLVHLGSDISDFADTAAIISQLNLVICVDTAVAHLAGALQIPCWVMLPYVGTDWRWMDERADSPWYPEIMRLFRQNKPNSWIQVVQEIAERLGASIACRSV